MIEFGFMTPPLAEISLTSTANDAVDRTTYTFAAQSLGAAQQSRFIVVGTGQRNAGQTVSSMTIGGVSASLVKRQIGASGFNVTELWGASVPTGATGDVVINWSAGVTRCAIAIYRILYLQKLTAISTYSSTADPLSASISVPNGGVAVAFSYGAVSTTNTWTGLTKDVDSSVESQCYSSASASFISDKSSFSVTCAGAIAYTDPAMALAVFR